MEPSFCTQAFPKLWSSFVDHVVDFGFTGHCCAAPQSQTQAPEFPSKISLPAAPRLVSIGDLHGDLDKARRAFQLAGLADADGNWVGRTAVCVQVGDILDRGDDEIRIFYYLEKLQQQARAAGGQLHVLNGNHETMTAAGQHRYSTQGSAKELLRWHWWQDIAALMKHRCATCNTPPSSPPSPSHASAPAEAAPAAPGDGAPAPAPPPPSVLLELQEKLQEKGLSGHKAAARHLRQYGFGPGRPLAQRFLAPHPTVLQVGSSVFVHGGILPHHVEYGLDRINRETAAWMSGEGPPEQPQFLTGSSAIVWARDYSAHDEARCDCDKLQQVLASIPGAQRMVVGHTIQDDGINSACDRRVLRVDVGMSRGCGDGNVEALEILQDQQVRRLQEKVAVLPPLRTPPTPGPFWEQVRQAATGAARA